MEGLSAGGEGLLAAIESSVGVLRDHVRVGETLSQCLRRLPRSEVQEATALMAVGVARHVITEARTAHPGTLVVTPSMRREADQLGAVAAIGVVAGIKLADERIT